jgi:hypothetical protein
VPNYLEIHDRLGCELVAETLRISGQSRVRVMGTSMLPALRPGDILIIRARLAAPSPGDIVVFMRQGRLFAHRVVRVGKSQLITRGDALPGRDPPLRGSEALGVVAGIIRDGAQPLPARPPSIAQRVAALAFRHSAALYRLLLSRRIAAPYVAPRRRAGDARSSRK